MRPKKYKAAVIGGSGYGGGEIIRRLLLHPDVELSRVASIDHVGELLSQVHLNLEGRTELRFLDIRAVEAADGMDVVFFCLPHAVSAEKMPEVIEGSDAKIVDLSGAFRCADESTYARWYGVQHPHPEYLEAFIYGLPELNRAKIRQSRCVANPGCFATCIELGLFPLARKGWLVDRIETVGITGSSGSGAHANSGTHHPIRALNLKTYRPLSHPQSPEISETLEAAGAGPVTLSFVPVSAPLSRGLFVSSFTTVDADLSEEIISEAFEEVFRQEPLTRIPQGRLPEVAAVAGSSYAEVGVVVGSQFGEQRQVTCFSALDNLIKGGAGQAIQNMNLLLGLEETTALYDPGSWP